MNVSSSSHAPNCPWPPFILSYLAFSISLVCLGSQCLQLPPYYKYKGLRWATFCVVFGLTDLTDVTSFLLLMSLADVGCVEDGSRPSGGVGIVHD